MGHAKPIVEEHILYGMGVFTRLFEAGLNVSRKEVKCSDSSRHADLLSRGLSSPIYRAPLIGYLSRICPWILHKTVPSDARSIQRI